MTDLSTLDLVRNRSPRKLAEVRLSLLRPFKGEGRGEGAWFPE